MCVAIDMIFSTSSREATQFSELSQGCLFKSLDWGGYLFVVCRDFLPPLSTEVVVRRRMGARDAMLSSFF